MITLPTLSECLAAYGHDDGVDPSGMMPAGTVPTPMAPVYKLEALELWLRRRGDATISVGVVAVDSLRRCSVMAHGQTFTGSRHGVGFEASWFAILAAVGSCEQFEAAQFGHVG